MLPDRSNNWNFDGNFMDSVGIADAVAQGPVPEFVTDGVPSFLGEAVRLNGDGLLVDPIGLEPIGEGDFSIAAWVKIEQLTTGNHLVFDGNLLGGIAFVVFNKGIRVNIHTNEQGGHAFSGTPGVIQENQWHHIAVTVDRDDPNGVVFYLDGVVDSVVDPALAEGYIEASPVPTFGEQDDGNTPLNRLIGDFTLLHRVMNPDEVLRIANGVTDLPMPRFNQPVENGILYSLMPVSEYDEAGLITVRLQAPGPGGGVSNSVDLTVAAPQPIVQVLEPSTVVPGSGAFKIRVEGPLSVPFFDGFEQERYGNFNKSSVVLFDGIELETSFISPGLLTAVVPEVMAAVSGSVFVSVYTPDNGTTYFDDHRGEHIVSGGVSNPVPFEIRYPDPIIRILSPETTTIALVNRCPDNPGQIRLSLTGIDFYPGATIWIDGVEFDTFTQTELLPLGYTRGLEEQGLTDNVIYTYISVENLERIYQAPIVVVNPDGYTSNEVYLNIVDQATYEAIYSITLPEQGAGCK